MGEHLFATACFKAQGAKIEHGLLQEILRRFDFEKEKRLNFFLEVFRLVHPNYLFTIPMHVCFEVSSKWIALE